MLSEPRALVPVARNSEQLFTEVEVNILDFSPTLR